MNNNWKQCYYIELQYFVIFCFQLETLQKFYNLCIKLITEMCTYIKKDRAK